MMDQIYSMHEAIVKQTSDQSASDFFNELLAHPEFFQSITTVGSSIGIATPFLFAFMYLLNSIDLSTCTGSGKTLAQCAYNDGMATSSKWGLITTTLSVPIRIVQLWLTTAPDETEEHTLGSNRYLQLIVGLDTIIQGVSLLSLFVTFCYRGISDFLGDTPNVFFDLFVLLLNAIQLTSDVSYLVYLQTTLNVL